MRQSNWPFGFVGMVCLAGLVQERTSLSRLSRRNLRRRLVLRVLGERLWRGEGCICIVGGRDGEGGGDGGVKVGGVVVVERRVKKGRGRRGSSLLCVVRI